MYDYRRMTPEQKREVVAARRSKGFPLHKPPHLALRKGWYFITAATFEHRHHFEASEELTALQNRLMQACEAGTKGCAGWVVMPNHYHLLVEIEALSAFGKCLGGVHGRSSRYVNLRDSAAGRKVWYKYSDRKVRNERHFWTCLHYILLNPVKHGFTEAPYDWAWSSIHELRNERGDEWIESLQSDFPLRDFGKGWDD